MNELIDIRSKIMADSLDSTLQRLLRIATDRHLSKETQELESIRSTYHYLKQYLLTGYNDSKRDTLYRELKLSTYEVSSKMLTWYIAESNRSFAQAKEETRKNQVAIEDIEKNISHYISELTFEKNGENNVDRIKQVYEQLYAYRKNLFNSIYSNTSLTSSEEKLLTNVCLSPAISATDMRLIISSMMLSQQLLFDIRKFRILVEIYCRHTNVDVRQYALIAIVLAQPNSIEMALYDEEFQEACKYMAEVPNVQNELFEIQLQMLQCADTKETQKTINDEIIPVLRSKATGMEINAEKSEKELLDELIHPDKEEKALDDIEKSLDRIREMRDAGADIFFAGFSQTKRFSFFYTLMNWFVPFSANHPQVASVATGDIPAETITKLMDTQCFCDSDKYSFYLTFSRVVQQIPQQLLGMLKRGEVDSELGETKQDTAFRRRLYLQDLYRFYTLYSLRIDFCSPFSTESTIVFSTWELVRHLFSDTNYILSIARQLLKRNYLLPLNQLLDNSFDELNLSYLKLKGMIEERKGNYSAAMEWFRAALTFEPENTILIRKMGETATLIPDYGLAKQLYSTLIELSKGEDLCDEEYNYAVCCLHTKDAKSAMKTLYKLYYLHEDNLLYRQTLAWGLLLSDKYDEAIKIYEAMSPEDMNHESNIRYALTRWLSHDKVDAMVSLRNFVRLRMLSPQELSAMLVQQNEACDMKISEVDLYVITDLVYDNSL